MRQVGMISDEADARRFADYLITLGVAAHAEQDADQWAIWVRDEDQLGRAKAEIEQFRVEPDASRYQGAQQQAESIRRDQVKRREKMRQNVVVMGSRWRSGAGKKAPLVFTLIAMSVAATLWTNFGKNRSKFKQLRFCSELQVIHQGTPNETFVHVFADIQRGQIWRLVTPIFIHLDYMHLIFNMIWTYVLGALIEDRRGTLRIGILVLAIALVSNVLQASFGNPNFGGMSGVGYGLFGYAWMKTLYDPSAGIQISRLTIILFIVWFFVCLSNFMPVANIAHGAGLVVGVAVGYAPVLARSMK